MACLVALAPPLHATDIWVSGTGSDGGAGTFADPYRTIKTAMFNANANDVIKVLTGDYDVNAGEVFPLSIKPGVDILGQETDEENWPRIGGDVVDSDVRALFEVVAADEDLGEVRLQKLNFLGEDSEALDAPHAVYIETSEGGLCSVIIDSCKLARSEMNEGEAYRQNVLAVAGNGTLQLNVMASTFLSNRGGALDVRLGDDCSSEVATALVHLNVSSSTFAVGDSDGADFAVKCFLEADEEPRMATCLPIITGNLVDSREAVGEMSGFQDGIVVGCAVTGYSPEATASIIFPHAGGDTTISDNDIFGCRGTGMKVVCEAGLYGTAELQIWHLDRNEIAYCGGDGLLIDAEENYEGYVRAHTQSNLIYRNNNGMVIKADESLLGGFGFFYDTIVYNDSYGVVVNAAEDYINNWANSISYFNGDGAYASTVGWAPSDVVSGGWETNDWQGYGTYFDPQFVNSSSNDFHIGSSSGCRNAGTNVSQSAFLGSLLSIDHFGGPRIREITKDIGCDEHDA
jgi:hypothetical protein